MLSQKSARSRQRSKLISYRVDVADWQLLHAAADKNGVQGILDGWFQPRIAELRENARKSEERCEGK